MVRTSLIGRIALALWISAASLFLASCANISTISRTSSLPGTATTVTTVTDSPDGKSKIYDNRTSASKGVAIHLDAPQRLAYVNGIGQLCAEPSPDAIQAYAASLGASLVVPGKAAEIAAALSASTSGIGLRTQAITLMRDHLYRICEAYYNGLLNPSDVVQMLQRSQDLTLGVLAIEQLTGAVVARQPMLTPEASASAARNMLNRSVEALEGAKKTESAKKAAVEEKTAARDALKGVGKDAELAKAEAALKEAQTDYKDAQAITAVRRAELDNGTAAVNAATKSGGQFSPEAERNNINKDTAAVIAEATKSIVEKVLNKGHQTDTCLNLLSAQAQNKAQVSDALLELCTKAVVASLEAIASYNDAVRRQNEGLGTEPPAETQKEKEKGAGGGGRAPGFAVPFTTPFESFRAPSPAAPSMRIQPQPRRAPMAPELR